MEKSSEPDSAAVLPGARAKEGGRSQGNLRIRVRPAALSPPLRFRSVLKGVDQL